MHVRAHSRIVERHDVDREKPRQHPLCKVTPLDEEELTPARQERLLDEAEAARTLVARAEETGQFSLEASNLDEGERASRTRDGPWRDAAQPGG